MISHISSRMWLILKYGTYWYLDLGWTFTKYFSRICERRVLLIMCVFCIVYYVCIVYYIKQLRQQVSEIQEKGARIYEFTTTFELLPSPLTSTSIWWTWSGSEPSLTQSSSCTSLSFHPALGNWGLEGFARGKDFVIMRDCLWFNWWSLLKH